MKIIILTRHTSFNLADKKNIIKKYDPRVIDKITYSYIKILEKNIKLENEVKKIRKKLHIPSNGFTLKEYDHFIKTEMKLVMNKNVMEASNPTKRAIKLLDNARKESYKINDLFNIHPAIATSTQFLILFNGVYVSNIDIQIVGSVDDYLTQAEDETLFNIDSIKIIVSKVVKKNQLIRFIKDNWKEIELEMKKSKVPNKKSIFISERDLRIIEMKDKQGMTYQSIGEELFKESNYTIDSLDKTTVQRAYKRAKTKIAIINR